MHDIICPKCGEKYIARDVAFDISEFVTELLYDSNQRGIRDMIQEMKFKYYIDEETLEKNHVIGSGMQLACSVAAGPTGDWDWYQCKITKGVLWDYIQEKCRMAYTFDIAELVESLSTKIQSGGSVGRRDRNRHNRQGSNNDTSANDSDSSQNEATPVIPTAITDLEKKNFLLACRLLFEHRSFHMGLDLNGTVTSTALANFEQDSAVKTAIQVFKYLMDGSIFPEDGTDVTLQVATFSKQDAYGAKYAIPDILFIREAEIIRKPKICRYCGYHLPDEFGYYPIKPIVVLGSHNAGKTSFLASLLNTIHTTAPFCLDYFGGKNNLNCSTLLNDEDAALWSKQETRFAGSFSLEKTPLDRQPVLNIKVKTPNSDNKYTIYSFVDWAGEVFISNDPNAVKFDPLRYQKLFRWTRHLLMFLEPTQIDSSIPPNIGKEENVAFRIVDLVDKLKTHLGDLVGGKFSSLTYILCQADRFEKSDRFAGLPAAIPMLETMKCTPEANIYSNGQWDRDALNRLQTDAVNFLQTTNMTILTKLVSVSEVMGSHTNLSLNYIPVAPYGKDVGDRIAPSDQEENSGMANEMRNIQSRCVGIPFLMCLHKDGII